MSSNAYQPFLISEFKSGLFNYLEPWIRPTDAFDPLINAYIYRGSLNKRAGYSVFGRMAYEDNGIQIAVGNGTKSYTGTLATFPIRAGTMSATEGVETFSDNGMGVLTGDAGGTGTIVYTTGIWTLNFNANVANGVIIRASYTYVPTQTTTPAALTLPIMGLKQWVDEASGLSRLLAMDTRRASVFNPSTNQFDPIGSLSQVLWQAPVSGTVPTTFTVSTNFPNLAPYSVTVSYPSNSMTDDGVGGFPGAGFMQNTSTVNYATGSITINFSSALPNNTIVTVTADLSGDYFTGDYTNFFNATNWQTALYMTNDKDPITLYNGTTLSRPPFPITQANQIAFVNNIGACLDIDVYKNRLLVQRPTIINAGDQNGFAPQSIRYSQVLNPTNLVADVSGNGGENSAPTADFMQSSEFLRDQLIVMFTNSTWTFRFTGVAFDPFRWDKLNNSKSTNAPYGTIDYDERVTAMGTKGLIACDGVNVQRYDNAIVDEFLEIDADAFSQCFGQRFDTLNQSWMLYPTQGNLTSQNAFVYNFVENTWAIYDIPLSCLGLTTISFDVTWANFAVGTPLGTEFPDWASAQFAWDSYLEQGLSPILVGGGQTGLIYQMNTGTTDNQEVIVASITSTRWNPFVGTGSSVQFGYIDFYYEVISPNAVLTLSFFLDNSSAIAAQRDLTLDGPTNSTFQWKRVYINANGQFLSMNITASNPATFKIVGMILWAREAGRLTG